MPPQAPCGYQWYGAAEGLYTWMRRPGGPPLVATGALGAPSTAVALGSTDLGEPERFGGRITLGHWLSSDQTFAVESSYLQLAERNPVSRISSAGPLGVPFADVAAGESFAPVAAPGGSTGGVEVEETSRFWTGEVNLRCEMCRGCWAHLDLLLGARAFGFDESLELRTESTAAAGGSTATSDRFGTHNLFLGGQVGLEAELHHNHWFADISGKVAVGDNREEVNINGTTLLTPAGGAPAALPGGLLALPTNSGQHRRDDWALLPEVGVHLGYQLNNHLRLYTSYSFLYMVNVVRPGDQIDRTVNTTQQVGATGAAPGLTGPARPTLAFHDTDVWVQGVGLGLEFRY
jgi:hypothetical protein